MASSASGQDDPNRALWLATRAGKMSRYPSGQDGDILPARDYPLYPASKIVQFRIRLDRWLKALRTHLYRVNLDLK